MLLVEHQLAVYRAAKQLALLRSALAAITYVMLTSWHAAILALDCVTVHLMEVCSVPFSCLCWSVNLYVSKQILKEIVKTETSIHCCIGRRLVMKECFINITYAAPAMCCFVICIVKPSTCCRSKS